MGGQDALGPATDIRDRSEREVLAEAVADRMDKPLTALGIIFLLVVLADTTTAAHHQVGPWIEAATWLLWGVFAAEFVLRAAIAPSTPAYLRRNWWQIVFLVLPFLRFMRVAGRLGRLRPGRLGRLLSSTVRGLRTAARTLTSRIAWLAAVTTIVVLSASQILYEFVPYDSYPAALHDAAYAAVTGEPIRAESGVADVLELVLAVYAMVVFAFLAGSLGAYLLERRAEGTGSSSGAIGASAPAPSGGERRSSPPGTPA